MKKLGKKLFTVSVVALTIVWSVGVSAFLPTGVKAVDCPELQAGDLFKAKGNSAVFLLNDDLQKMDFFSAEVYYSWYSDSLAKEGGVEVDGSCLDNYNYGGTVSFRPGSGLVKGPSAAVYTMLPDGSYKKIANEAAAIKLFGSKWYTLVRDVTEGSYFSHFKKASGELDGSALVDGMLVKTSATGKVYSITDGMSYEVEGTLPKALANDVRTVSTALFDSVEASGDTTTPVEITADPSMGLVTSGTGTGTGTTVVSGNLTASLAASTPSAQDVPTNVMVEFLRLNLAASATADATVNGIKLSSTGLGDYSQIDGVTVFVNGARYGSSRDIDSNKVAQINFTSPLVIAKGTSVTMVVKAKVTHTSKYALEVTAASDINSTASVGGSFPIRGNNMAGVSTAVGALTIENDGTLSDVKLGDTSATVAKFKVTVSSTEDVSFKSISLKKDSTTSTIADSDVVNYKLYLDGVEIASAPSMVGKYVNFTLATPVTMLKNTVKRFTVKADVVAGAGKLLQLTLDNVVDADAMGMYYNYPVSITNSMTGTDITINAGAVTIEKVNATNTKIKKDTKDVEFGSFKVTVNSGKTVELSTLKLTAVSTNDAAGTQIENVEVLVKNNNTVYDMTSSTGNGVYRNTSMGLVLNSGTTYEFVVRADTKSNASTGDYTWSIANATTDMVMKETGNDTTVIDITPNSVSLNKVTVDVASVAFSKNALSATLSAVVGATNVELFNFNVKAGASSEVKITQLKFKDNSSSSITKSVVSEFRLYKGTDLIKTVSANDLSSEEITFNDLNQLIAADQTATYKLTTSLVKDVNQDGVTTTYGLTGYSIEETTKGAAVYDANIDPATSDGVVVAGAFQSARVVTVRGYGSLDITVDNTVDATKFDSNVVAGTTGVPVGTFKFNASNEDVKVTSLSVVTSTDLSSLISRISLYDGDTEVAYTTNIGTVTSTLDQDFIVSGQKYYTLKVNLNQIGKDQAGLVNKTGSFRIANVEAEGNDSGYTLVAGGTTGGVTAGEVAYESDTATQSGLSKTAYFTASKISTVSLVSSYGSTALATKLYSGTQANAAIVAVTVPATNNKNSDGTALKFAISNLKMKIDQGGTWSGYSAKLERIGGSGATVDATTSTTYMTFASLSGSDYQITPNSVNPVTAYFLVKVTPMVTTTNPGDTAMTVGLDGLNNYSAANTSAGAAFKWTDLDGTDSAGTSASAKYALNIPGVSTVSGITISN